VCTATWRREENGFELLFNRDELKSRAEAHPPRRRDDGDRPWIAPVDGDFGGTWIAANSAGLAVGILNGFRRADAFAVDPRSRGLLVADLADARDVAGLRERLLALDLSIYRSFRLLALDPSPAGLVAEWDGERLATDDRADARRPLVSSSFDESEVGRRRRAEYARSVGGGEPSLEALRAYHRFTGDGPSAYTVSMERPEARTRSLTQVLVRPDGVEMTYHGTRPDLPAPESVLRLDRESLPSRSSPGPEAS